MSGHNKWAQIKRQKAVTDGKRSKMFGKIARIISIAARDKGPDPSLNISLKSAMQKAREVNMPQDNIDRAIKKGVGGGEGVTLQEFVYEAYGPGGVALLMTGITDNNNRTSNEIKHLLSERGGKWANPGSVLWAFEKKEAEWIPQEYSLVEISPTDTEALYKLMDALDEHDDIQDIFVNNKES
ncbi:MAG: YebC/PmpR family DNA-binding transcriptional regulator [Candidatus Ryanbacteria bacterium]|nr:YebC/PmpR family DNA-binding transcriptional regulator [Candidatus Ryanbacteria bacterium]